MSNIEHDEEIGEVDAVDNTELPVEKKEEPAPDPKMTAALAPKQDTRAAMGLDDRGLVSPKDSSEAWRLAELFLKSKAIPKQFENVAQVFMARQFLLAHKLNPEIGIRQTTIINGTLSIWGDLPKAICERSGLIEEFSEIIINKEYVEISFQNKNLSDPEWGAVCSVKREGKPAITRSFTMDEAKKAGLLDKTNSVWKSYPRRMLQMRARSLALKDAFPDVLSGIAINEYDYDGGTDGGAPRDMLPEGKKSVAEEINEVFLSETQEAHGQEGIAIN